MIPSYEGLQDDPSSFNILLMGKHGSNVDTIMFANINSDMRQVTLISLPRDLYVDGRKINSYYGMFGIREQVRRVQEVVGYKIHKYALVDMYVFRDIIDLMDGVTVTLEEDLVDPTYKTCDNGICSTLYYEAGSHELNGTQALRVARSRYTTSDYSRAERQQIILEGIQAKAQSLGFGDAGTLKELVSTVVRALETDVTVDEALRYYFRYQNFEIARGNVVSTGNVLSAVPVPVEYETSHPIWICGGEVLSVQPNEEEMEEWECEATYAIDTLQPVDGNWDAIRWYVQSLLN